MTQSSFDLLKKYPTILMAYRSYKLDRWEDRKLVCSCCASEEGHADECREKPNRSPVCRRKPKRRIR